MSCGLIMWTSTFGSLFCLACIYFECRSRAICKKKKVHNSDLFDSLTERSGNCETFMSELLENQVRRLRTK